MKWVKSQYKSGWDKIEPIKEKRKKKEKLQKRRFFLRVTSTSIPFRDFLVVDEVRFGVETSANLAHTSLLGTIRLAHRSRLESPALMMHVEIEIARYGEHVLGQFAGIVVEILGVNERIGRCDLLVESATRLYDDGYHVGIEDAPEFFGYVTRAVARLERQVEEVRLKLVVLALRSATTLVVG